MLHMQSQNVKKLRYEIDPIEKLGRPVQAPVQELYKSRHAISLQHVISILS